MIRIKWPVAMATLFVALLGWYVLYSQRIVRALRADAETLTQIFAGVQEGLMAREEGAAVEALYRLQGMVIASGVPMVVTVPRRGPPWGDSVLAVENTPFEVDLDTPEGQRRMLAYVSRLDARHPPVGDEETQHVHFGDTPEIRRLRWIPWLQAAGLLLTVVVGFALIRYQRRAESERAWTAMARELAHQLGTPISSLQGWLEVLRLDPAERPGELEEGEVARAIEEDLVRLERVSHRFELIGREPELDPVSLTEVVGDLERYLQVRLPRLGADIRLEVDVPEGLPPIRGNEVLLAWALENIVKNSLDALAGRGGKISIRARVTEPDWVRIRLTDTGPGVDLEMRDRIFEPGVSSKAGGWGVGLALARRIVEGVHGGRIELLEGGQGGATFEVRLPTT